MFKNIVLCFVSVFLLISLLSANCSPLSNDGRVDEVTVTVNTRNGQVRGHRAYTLFDHKLFYTFKGIPYGQPPVGSLRFKAPEPANSWNGVLDAEHFGNQCIQPLGGSEDCLYLNVYTPNVSPQQLLPVLIIIHGGRFIVGSPDDHEPDFLFNQGDCIMVHMNYRLGPFGFLTLDTPEFAGNMGLKDQQLAMQWVVDNIHNFGGDANHITLYGISAGGAAAHNHVLSETSQKLFQRAIVVSASALNPWALTTENHFKRVQLFAEEHGVYINDTNEIISFLQNSDAASFFGINSILWSGALDNSLDNDYIAWAPVVEPAGSKNPVLQRSPSDILQNNFATNIDTLFAVASEESLFNLVEEMSNPSLLQPINENFKVEFPIYSINQDFDFESERFSQISANIRHQYFGNQDIDIGTIPNYASLRSDIMFNYGVDRAARLHAGSPNANTYHYRFSFDGVLNIFMLGTIAHAFGIEGATHGDDSYYVFRRSDPHVMSIYSLLHESSMERQTIEELSKAYTSFILTGNLTSNFMPVQPNNLYFIDYTNNGPVLRTNPFEERMTFWDNLIQENELY